MPRALSLALLAAALCAAAPPAFARPAATIPAPFRGIWNGTVLPCSPSASDDTRLELTARRVNFYESGGTVSRVTRVDARTIRIVGRLSGEGETFTARYPFRLSADGRQLTDITQPEHFVRHRCRG